MSDTQHTKNISNSESSIEALAGTARVIETPDGPTLDMPCPKYGRCYPAPPVRREPAGRLPSGAPFWQWIGPADAPSITPSIGCDNKCGQHRVITNGRWDK